MVKPIAMISLLAACHVALPAPVAPMIAAADRAAVAPEPAPSPPATAIPLATPAPSRGRIWGSLPLAIVGTVVGAVAGVVVIGSSLGCTDEGMVCSNGPDNGEYIAGGLVSGLGAAAGAYVGGLRHDSRGRFWLDLVVAMVPASIVAIASGASNSQDACGSLCLIPMAATPIVATAVDYLYRVGR